MNAQIATCSARVRRNGGYRNGRGSSKSAIIIRRLCGKTIGADSSARHSHLVGGCEIDSQAVCAVKELNANDIAVMGAQPRYFLATILLPDGSSESDAESVFDQINDACRAIDVTLIGGHTEITPSVTSVVVSGCMLGEADEGSLITSAGARVGDAVILAGGIAVEGTTILARDASDTSP